LAAHDLARSEEEEEKKKKKKKKTHVFPHVRAARSNHGAGR
jgi:hypothetical protein